MNLSINLITNESFEKVRDFLDNASFADEIILVDTGSKENLKELSKNYPNVKYFRSWFNNWFKFKVYLWDKRRWLFLFNKARNYALSKSTKDWILILDTDERIEHPEHIERLIKGDYKVLEGKKQDIDAWRLLQVHKGDGEPDAPCSTTRLWKNGLGIHYQMVVHETPDTSIGDLNLKVAGSDLEISHYGFTDRTKRHLKSQRIIDGIEYEKAGYANYNLGVAYFMANDLKNGEKYLWLAIQEPMANNIKAHAHILLADYYKQLANHNRKLSFEQANASIELIHDQNLAYLHIKDLYLLEGNKRMARRVMNDLRKRDTTTTKMHQDVLIPKEGIEAMSKQLNKYLESV